MRKEKKIYLVKREVKATSIASAMRERGFIYSIEMVDEKLQPESKKGPLGFKPKSK
jgi:hypothetical protein